MRIKKDYFIFTIILFSIIFSQTEQYSLQTKETNETNDTLDARDIDYKEGKALTKYDKKFDYLNQKFNDAALTFFFMNNLEDFKISFKHIFLKQFTKEKLNKDLNKLKLRHLQNGNSVTAIVDGTMGQEVQVISSDFSPQPEYVMEDGTPLTIDSGQVSLPTNEIYKVEMVWQVDDVDIKTTKNMFYGCFQLTYLDLSNLDTSQVTNMENMFGECLI